MEDFIMYEKYLEQLEEAGKIRNLKERSINCYKNYVSYFLTGCQDFFACKKRGRAMEGTDPFWY